MKKLWNKLAKKNAKYFINSDYGQDITEEEFIRSGQSDCIKHIDSDTLFKIHKVFLEIGCGNGRMTQFIKEGHNVLAIDISGEMIKQARERVSGVYFAETDGYTIPFDDNSIDYAFSYLVFQHMKIKEMVESNFKEVYRVLKPGGIFKVRLRTDSVNDKMHKWWAGVNYDEDSAVSIALRYGFGVLKTEQVENYGLWLWLKKP